MATLKLAGTASAPSDWWTERCEVGRIRELAHLAGLHFLPSSSVDKSVVSIPVTLIPTKFPRDKLELVTSTLPDLNVLLDSVSSDLKFLEESLQGLVGPWKRN